MKIVRRYDLTAELTNEEQVRESIKHELVVNIRGFNNVDDAKEFANKFPKYVKLYAKTLRNSNGKELEGFCVFSVGNTNNVTGEINETGIKRTEGFIKTLKKLNII